MTMDCDMPLRVFSQRLGRRMRLFHWTSGSHPDIGRRKPEMTGAQLEALTAYNTRSQVIHQCIRCYGGWAN